MTGLRQRLFVLVTAAYLAALGGCAEQGVAPTLRVASAADSADQILESMTMSIVREGVRQGLVYADTAYIYQDSQRAVFRNLRATFFDAQGTPTSVLTARWGEYHIHRGALEARDSVVVVSADAPYRRLSTAHLVYDRDRGEVRSDSAFVYEGADGVLRGRRFTADPGFKRVVTDQPSGRQRGQGILLPGQ